MDGVGNFTCHCPAGFTGDMCECPLNPGTSGGVDIGPQNKSANGTDETAQNGSTVIGKGIVVCLFVCLFSSLRMCELDKRVEMDFSYTRYN